MSPPYQLSHAHLLLDTHFLSTVCDPTHFLRPHPLPVTSPTPSDCTHFLSLCPLTVTPAHFLCSMPRSPPLRPSLPMSCHPGHAHFL